MTTIAYRDGVLAADTAVTDRGVFCGCATKIFRSPTGAIGGIAGCMGDSGLFRDWLLEGAEGLPPEFRDDASEGLVVWPTGDTVWVSHDQRLVPVQAEYHAVGSGFQIAMGAMAAGATAERAVEIACDLDTRSRRPLTVMTLEAAASPLPGRRMANERMTDIVATVVHDGRTWSLTDWIKRYRR